MDSGRKSRARRIAGCRTAIPSISFADPEDPARLYTNAGAKGIFQSLDSGATWTKISDALIDQVLTPDTNNIKIAVGPNHTLYVAVANYANGAISLAGLFRSGDGGSSWTALDLPSTIEAGDIVFGLHPGGQGGIHLSLAADNTDANIVYIGGDRQPSFDEGASAEPQTGCYDEPVPSWPNSLGACDYSGRLFRIDASLPPGQQAMPITHSGTASKTAPHADSRGLVMSPSGDLIEVDDGGIYRRTNPRSKDGDWFSMNGSLQVTELHSAAWDSNTHTILGGAQDTGAPHQSKNLNRLWETILEGDGGVVAIDVTSTPGRSIRYVSNYQLQGFTRLNYDETNTLKSWDYPQLAVVGTSGEKFEGQFYTPLELNQVDPRRLIIGGARQVYELFDQGDTIEELEPPLAMNGSAAVAYGAAGNPDMLYVGSGKNIFIRNAPPPRPWSGPRVILEPKLSPESPSTLTTRTRLSSSILPTSIGPSDGGATWTKVSGNLSSYDPDILRSVVYSPDINGGSVVVGTNAGIFAAAAPGFSDWIRLGSGLPNAPVYRLQWSPKDQILLAGTHGRGAWISISSKGLNPMRQEAKLLKRARLLRCSSWRREFNAMPRFFRLANATPLIAVILALVLLLPLPSARSQEAVKSFELRPGVVVSLDKNEAYVMKPEAALPRSIWRKATSFGALAKQPSRSPCRATSLSARLSRRRARERSGS